MDSVIAALATAVEQLELAADYLSDIQAEYCGDRGLGVPPRDRRVERMYALAAEADDIKEGLSQ